MNHIHCCFFAVPLTTRDVFTKYRVDIKNVVQLEVFMDHFISRKIILVKQKESVTMDSLLNTIDSELESGIDVSLFAMLDVIKNFGTIGPCSLAEKIEQEISTAHHQLSSSPETVSVQFKSNERVEDMFLKLVPAIGNILKKSNCGFTLLRSACIKPDQLISAASKLPPEFIDKVNATKNIDELLDLLISCPYCNWINVRILEKLAASSGQNEAQELIDKYKTKIFSKKVADILQEFPDLEISEQYHTRVWDKWNKNFEDITVEDIANHWVKLQRIFGVEDLELVLENLVIGSIEFHWLIPTELTSHARLSAFKNWCDLDDISYLSIGDHVIKNDQLEFTEEHISITTGILT